MANPIGVSFLPNEENQRMGPQRAGMEGDLGQAMKILSLRLPRVWGAKAFTPPQNLPGASNGSEALQSPGSSFNPESALIEAFIKALISGGGSGQGAPDSMGGGGGMPSLSGFSGGSIPAPTIRPGLDGQSRAGGIVDDGGGDANIPGGEGPIAWSDPISDGSQDAGLGPRPPGGYGGYNPGGPFGFAGDKADFFARKFGKGQF